MQLPQILSNQNIGAENHSANARALHNFLNSEQQYADWIKNRIAQYGFIENQDYISRTVYTGRRPRKEYFITLDMAKELCMVENNDKGREARRYFIKCEQEFRAMQAHNRVERIACLEAQRKLDAKHNALAINGYKSVISRLNAKLAKFDKNLPAKYQQMRDERDYYRKKYNEAYEALGSNPKTREITLALAKISKELEAVYRAVGAVMSYNEEDDRYFMQNNEILNPKDAK